MGIPQGDQTFASGQSRKEKQELTFYPPAGDNYRDNTSHLK
jgi:hypothetical protein